MAAESSSTPLVLGGLHHVTAVTGNARANLEFYTQILGMHLVKKTVNQDDVSAYHLFYADELGSPGTDLTFFDWPQAAPCRPGTNMISEITLRVQGLETLHWWVKRFQSFGIAHSGIVDRAGRATLGFTDPEGQSLRLTDDGGKPGGMPWTYGTIPPEYGVHGLAAVTLTVPRLALTALVLNEVLGFRLGQSYTDAEGYSVTVFETAEGGPGAEVHIAERPDLPRGNVGRGGVHHVAFRTPDDETHRLWRERLQAAGLPVSGVIDRYRNGRKAPGFSHGDG